MSLSSSQQADRASAVPASDVSAVLGLNPYRSPTHVWLTATGKAPPWEGNQRTKWGDLLEPVIRDDYAERRGVHVEQVGSLFVDVGGVRIGATPDGIVFPLDAYAGVVYQDRPSVAGERGLEIKTHSVYAADYGPEGSDEVPIWIALQCQIGMYVTGLTRWDLVAFWDNQPHDYALTYDRATAEHAVEYCARWWRDHVVAHRMPTPDGSEATEAALRLLHPGTQRDLKAAEWITPDDGTRELIGVYRSLRREAAMAETLELTARQRLEAVIGGACGLAWDEHGKRQTITWRKSKDGKEVDYRAALVDFRNELALRLCPIDTASIADHGVATAIYALRELIDRGPDLARFTTTKAGSRRFCVPRSWSKDLPPGSGGDGE